MKRGEDNGRWLDDEDKQRLYRLVQSRLIIRSLIFKATPPPGLNGRPPDYAATLVKSYVSFLSVGFFLAIRLTGETRDNSGIGETRTGC
jgi:hypothetical protein